MNQQQLPDVTRRFFPGAGGLVPLEDTEVIGAFPEMH